MGKPLDLLIIGAGFGGLGMAAKTKLGGIDNFLVLEAANAIGGVWRDNIYPGAACDVPARLYWYGWDRQPDWSRVYAPQAEILGNLREFVDRHDLQGHLRLSEAVEELTWDEESGCWHVRSTSAEYRTRAIISAVGQLGTPSFRGIRDRHTFAGVQMHSAGWDHDVELVGRSVTVIGTGASAAQIIPEVVREAGRVIVVQNSAPWITPRDDRVYSPTERKEYKESEALQTAERSKIFSDQETRFEAFGLDSDNLSEFEDQLRAHLASKVSNTYLRTQLTPDYRFGCKRPVRSDDLLEALADEKVTVVPERVSALSSSGFVTASGQSYSTDVIVYATGFETLRFLEGIQVIGRNGLKLHEEAWAEIPEAYLGICVSGFPNLFLVYGPNTNTNNSAITVMDAQYSYILQALEKVQSGWVLDVREDVQAEHNVQVQKDCSSLTLTSGCSSWYLDNSGRVVSNWCSAVRRYISLTELFDLDRFEQANQPLASVALPAWS